MLERSQVLYLSYITVPETIPSMMEHGILSHVRARDYPHRSIADQAVQDLRDQRVLPTGRALHEYANVYFWARNAMMYRVRNNGVVCVLKVSPQVLNLPGVFYSTRNASALEARFHPCEGDFTNIERRILYSGRWVDENGVVDVDKMQRIQAEVLVPDRIPPAYIVGVFVRSDQDAVAVRAHCGNLDVIPHPGLFFEA